MVAPKKLPKISALYASFQPINGIEAIVNTTPGIGG